MNDKSDTKVKSKTFNFDDDDYNSQPSYEYDHSSSSDYDLHDQQIEASMDGYDSSELDVENEMSIMMTRDDYGFPFYESMGDLSFRDNREGFSPDDYTLLAIGKQNKRIEHATDHIPDLLKLNGHRKLHLTVPPPNNNYSNIRPQITNAY
jgi:hypothetical protein